MYHTRVAFYIESPILGTLFVEAKADVEIDWRERETEVVEIYGEKVTDAAGFKVASRIHSSDWALIHARAHEELGKRNLIAECETEIANAEASEYSYYLPSALEFI